jgi:hypothetical protein
MERIEDLKVTGEVTLTHYDEFMNVVGTQTVKNMVVTTGLEFIASRMAGTASAVMSHMALGASSTAAQLTDTALLSQLGSRVALAGGVASSKQVTYTATFGAGAATGAVVEAGIFNASTAGTMLCRTVFSVINKGAGDSLAVTWVITIS